MNISSVELFAALSHETRLRCVILLLSCDELCVCDLSEALGTAQPNISRHLGQLRAAGLLGDRRQGQWIYYRTARNLPDWVRGILHSTAEAIADEQPFAGDRRALAALTGRQPDTRCS